MIYAQLVHASECAAWMGEATGPAACLHFHFAAPQLAKEASNEAHLLGDHDGQCALCVHIPSHAQHVAALPCP